MALVGTIILDIDFKMLLIGFKMVIIVLLAL